MLELTMNKPMPEWSSSLMLPSELWQWNPLAKRLDKLKLQSQRLNLPQRLSEKLRSLLLLWCSQIKKASQQKYVPSLRRNPRRPSPFLEPSRDLDLMPKGGTVTTTMPQVFDIPPLANLKTEGTHGAWTAGWRKLTRRVEFALPSFLISRRTLRKLKRNIRRAGGSHGARTMQEST